MLEILLLYKNYLFALQERKEFGTAYGDTDEIMEMYEEKLKIKIKENVYEKICKKY